MHGRFCHVVPLDPAKHGPELWEAFSLDPDARAWTYLFSGPFESETALTTWLADAASTADPLFHAIIDPTTGHPVGLAAYLRIDPTMGVIEVGHLRFSSLLQRRPAATEAMYLMLRRAFDELGYRRYEWKCDALNAPSREAAERLGFQFEGIFRQAIVAKGRNRDTAWYSIIDKDWPEIRARLEHWLRPENFGPDGIQRDRLSRSSHYRATTC
jgi:RimJ/RimL family protein N-acetyltransferase